MPSSLAFYRSAGSDTEPEYFGAISSDETAIHFALHRTEGGAAVGWLRQTLNAQELWALEHTHPPFAPPYPIEQREFLHLLKAYILPPLPL